MNIKIEQIELLGNRILIKPDPVKAHEIISTGGLVTATGRKIESRDGIQSFEDIEPPTGVIVAIGDECTKRKVGERVMFSPFSGKKLDFMLETYLLMSEPEPVLVIKEK